MAQTGGKGGRYVCHTGWKYHTRRKNDWEKYVRQPDTLYFARAAIVERKAKRAIYRVRIDTLCAFEIGCHVTDRT